MTKAFLITKAKEGKKQWEKGNMAKVSETLDDILEALEKFDERLTNKTDGKKKRSHRLSK